MPAAARPTARSPLSAWLLLAALSTPTCLALLWASSLVPYGTEALGILEDLENKPLGELIGLRGAYFRPGFWLLLWSVWDGLPNVPWALTAFAWMHGASIALLLAGFLLVLRVRNTSDALCATFALAVLMALPGFRDNLENLPLNQMLAVMLLATATWWMLERPFHAWHAVALPAVVLLALAFKEQGLVVAALVVTGYWAAAPGVNRPTAAVAALVAAAYTILRLTTGGQWPVFAQSVGVGFRELAPEEAVSLYGTQPVAIYAYQVAATALNVLFSEPTRGVFTITRALRDGTVAPWQVIHLVSSAALTACIAWWAVRAYRTSDPDGREQRLVVLLVAAVVGSALLGFNYTRDRFGGVAALFYAFASYFCMRGLLGWSPAGARRWATAALVVALATSWHLRAAGTVLGLREAAWAARREWLVDTPTRRQEFADRPTYAALMDALYPQGSDPRAAPPRIPRWATALMGPR